MEKEYRMNRKLLCVNAILFFVIPIFIFGLISAFDVDPTVSKQENRTLKAMPDLTFKTLLNGDFTQDFDDYYSDTFPYRDGFIEIGNWVSKLLTQNNGKDNIVIINRKGTDDSGGESAK